MRRLVAKRRAERRSVAAAAALERLRAGSGPLIAGPWTGAVSFELMYWIPLLNWLTELRGTDGVAISRWGADEWYVDVATHYVDVLDVFSPELVERRAAMRVDGAGNEKISTFDKRVFQVARRLVDGRPEWVHPELAARLFTPYWRWGRAR